MWDCYRTGIEMLPRHSMQQLQLKKLRKMVDYCLEKSPFYQKKLAGAGIASGECIKTLDDICRIPFTTKEDLREQYPDGMLAVPLDQVIRIHASSGTTGKPIVGFYTKKDLELWSDVVARVLVMSGVKKNDVVQISVAYGLFTGALGFQQGADRIGCTVIPQSTGNTEKQLVMMHDMGATTLIATPTYAVHLAEKIRKTGHQDEYKLKKVILGAERCSESARRMIAETLKVDVLDNYGLTEFFGPGVAAECPAHGGLHIAEDMFYPEIVDPVTGDPMPDGEQGELILTSLEREAMPLLRFRTRDITSIVRSKCACGRTGAIMKAPFGRTDEMFVYKGINVYPSQIETAIAQVKELTSQYRILLTRDSMLQDRAVVQVELEEDFSFAEKERISERFERELRKIVIVKLEIELCRPNTLERCLGKVKHVYDNRYEESQL